jgi:hypothetical protein
LRLDAALDDPSPPREPGTTGRPRLKGTRRPTLAAVLAEAKTHWTALIVAPWYGAGPREVAVATDTAVWDHAGKPPVAIRWGLMRDPQQAFDPQAWLSTPPAQTPAPIRPGCVRRWTLEVTVAEARAQLGLATQRQWHARAMARTTPARLCLYSISTLTAHRRIDQGATCVRRTAWSRNTHPTCSDAMALVRRHLWDHPHCSTSQHETDMIQIPRVVLERFTEALCYAA